MKPEPASPKPNSDIGRRISPKQKGTAAAPPVETVAFAVGAVTNEVQAKAANGAGPSSSSAVSTTFVVEPREKVGRFRIQKLLGRGGMGSVFLAHDDQLDRPVALKIPRIPDESEAAERLVSRFLREARAAAILSHPNICPIYDVGRDGNTHFIAMGFVKGQPLTTYVTSDRPQPNRQVALVVRKVALALEDAHQKGILHRDLKPANIMIDQRGEPIVMDFGLACRLDDGLESRLTQDGKVVGTPTYMSPEQIDGRAPVGAASDVYSLGVVMYELLAGKCPFSGSLVSVIGQVLNVEPKPVAEIRPDVPQALAETCHRAMAKNVADRFASMQEFADALTDFLKGTTFANKPAASLGLAPLPDWQQIDALLSQPLSGATNLAGPSLRKRASRQWPGPVLWASAIGAAAILIGAIVFASLGGHDPNGTDEHGSTNVAAVNSTRAVQPKATEPSPVRPDPIQSTAIVQQADSAAAIHSEPAAPAAGQSTAPTPVVVPQSPPSQPVLPAAPLSTESKPGDIAAPSAAGKEVGEAPAAPTTPMPSTPVPSTPAPSTPVPSVDEGRPVSPMPAPNIPATSPGPPPLGPNGGPSPAPPGQIDSVEALVKFFKQADRNHDNRLDGSELPMHIIHRAAKNGQQFVSLTDLKRAFQKMGSALFGPPTADEMRMLPSPPPGPRRRQ